MIISIYCLKTEDFTMLPFLQILLGLNFIIMGFREWKRGKKAYVSLLYFGVAIFILFVFVISFFD